MAFASSSIAGQPIAERGARSLVDPRSLPTYRLLALMAGTIALLVPALGFTVERHDIPLVLACQAFLIGIAFVLRGRGLSRAATAIEASMLVFSAVIATACLSMLLATSNAPYADPLLDRIDAVVMPNFSWLDMYRWASGDPRIVADMCAVYQTLTWQPVLIIVLLALAGQEASIWRFTLAWSLTLIGCVAIFPLFPAAGAFVHYGLPRGTLPTLSIDTAWRQVEVLDAIRSGALRTIAPAQMTGIIAFPSFHAAGATLLAWGFAKLRWIGLPMVVFNIGVAATAPLIGSHYFIDIVAGIALALLAIHASGAAWARPHYDVVSQISRLRRYLPIPTMRDRAA